MTNRIHRYFQAALTTALTFGVGFYVIPWFRLHPEDIHNLIDSLPEIQKKLFTPFSCLFLVFLFFKLFSPRFTHLKYFLIRPPVWSMCFLGIIVLGGYDLIYGLGPVDYEGSQLEWLVYMPLSFIFWGMIWHSGDSIVQPKSQLVRSIELTDMESIELWINTNNVSNYDLLGNRQVASRLAGILQNGMQSIGVVGPFGSGKSTIINWMDNELNSVQSKFIVSPHSCWGFKDSSSSIFEMLDEAIKKIELYVDTFKIRSLPEAYRKTFASSGGWADAISNIALGIPDLRDQLKVLSSVLSEIDTTLVFVVEDLDRNDTRNFDIQEVVAFLQQLKEYDYISVVVTGGLDSSGDIDYAKLCDHIEYLKVIDEEHVSEIVRHAQERAFKSIDSFNKPISRMRTKEVLSLLDEAVMGVSFSEAIAILLSTPRNLKHALRRTLFAWGRLKGEVNFDHLLVINTLRFGAPEALTFLITRWDRLHLPPPDLKITESHLPLEVREMVKHDWESTIRNVEWDNNAATVLLESILPTFGVWLTEDDTCQKNVNQDIQGIHQARYWRRILNESIDPDEILDQTIVKDLKKWLEAPSINAELITKLTSSSEYGTLWIELAKEILAEQPDNILLICEHVISYILKKEGVEASYDSTGFEISYCLASLKVPRRKENTVWLKERLSEASRISLELVNSIWASYGIPGKEAIIRFEESRSVRLHVINDLKSNLKCGNDLIRLLHEKHPYILYQLVMTSGEFPTNTESLSQWAWLEPVFLDALKENNITVAKNVASLLATRDSGVRNGPWEVDSNILFGLFPNKYNEIPDLLDHVVDIIDEKVDQNMVLAISETARVAIEDKKGDDPNPQIVIE